MSLDDKLSILDEELFGIPEGMSEEDRERYEQVMPEEPRKTGTARDRMPEIEAGPLPDGRLTYLLARSVLSIFAGAIDMMFENLAPSRNEPGRTEVRPCVGAEVEEVGNDLGRPDREARAGGALTLGLQKWLEHRRTSVGAKKS